MVFVGIFFLGGCALFMRLNMIATPEDIQTIPGNTKKIVVYSPDNVDSQYKTIYAELLKSGYTIKSYNESMHTIDTAFKEIIVKESGMDFRWIVAINVFIDSNANGSVTYLSGKWESGDAEFTNDSYVQPWDYSFYEINKLSKKLNSSKIEYMK